MEFTDIGKKPISIENPAGQDVMYEPDFESLSEEINKLSSPTANTAINWDNVAQLSEKIIREQSKNLTASCYLTLANFHTQHLKGLAVAIHIMNDMLQNYWDTMYPLPKRKKARINILSWWNDKLQSFLRECEHETLESTLGESIINDLKSIDTIIAEKLEDGPNLRTLIEMISGLLVSENDKTDQTTEEQKPHDTLPEETQQSNADVQNLSPKKQSLPSSPSVETPSGETDADAYFKQGIDYLGTAATLFFEKKPENYLSYKLNRIIAWSEVDSPPPAKDKITLLPAPDPQVQTILTELHDSSRWTELLNGAETRVREYLFWLDLSYWSFTALENLQYKESSESVAADVLLFVNRLKDVERLAFSDGTPFANDDTLTWIDGLQSKPIQESVAATSVSTDQQNDINTEMLQAQKISVENGLGAMLTYLQEEIASSISVRHSFLLYIGLCQLIMKGNQKNLVVPFVEKILTLIDSHHLEQWEPELAADAMVTAYKCLKKVGKNKYAETLQSLFTKITILNAQKGLEIL